MNKKYLVAGMIAGGLLGILDTLYLTYKYFIGSELSCSIISGCEKVLNSEFSVIYGVPLAMIGLIYYMFITGLAASLLTRQWGWVSRAHLSITTLGIIISAGLVYIQYALIEAWCQFCLVSVLVTSITWTLSLAYYLKTKMETTSNSAE